MTGENGTKDMLCLPHITQDKDNQMMSVEDKVLDIIEQELKPIYCLLIPSFNKKQSFHFSVRNIDYASTNMTKYSASDVVRLLYKTTRVPKFGFL